MKLNISQRSKEWHDLRRKKIGASDIPIIAGTSPWSTVYQLIESKLSKKDKIISSAMQTGIDNEEMILELVQEKLKIGLIPAVYVHDSYEFAMASLDGISTREDLIVEIKSPQAKSHESYKQEGIPLHYAQQMQWQMFVTGVKNSVFASWYDGDLYLKELCFDEEQCLDLIKKGQEFYTEILAPLGDIIDTVETKFAKNNSFHKS